MSLASKKLVPVKVVQTLVDQTDPVYAVLKGTKVADYHRWATNSISGSSVSWTTQSPSGLVVDKIFWVVMPVRLTFTGTVTAPTTQLINPNTDAPRAWPLHQNLNSLILNINGSQFSISSYQIMNVMSWFLNRDVKETYTRFSGTPNEPDQSQIYSSLYGAIRNPLGPYGDSAGENFHRGAFPFTVVSNTSTSAVIDMVVVEPLLIPPLTWDGEEPGFANTNQINVNLNFLSNSNRWWSHDQTSSLATISSLVASYTNFSPAFSYSSNQPLLLVRYSTPDTSLPPILPNTSYNYPFYSIQSFVTDQANSVTSGSQVIITSNNLLLTSVPRKMYMCVRQRDQDLQSSTTNTDTFFQLNSLSINFNNVTGIFAGSDIHQLYEMSVRNRLNMNKTQWTGGPIFPDGSVVTANQYYGPGSIFACEFGTDLPIVDEKLVPGTACNTNLQMTVTATNINPNSIVPTIQIILVYEGCFTITSFGTSTQTITPLSEQDVLNAVASPHLGYNLIEHQSGGNFLSAIGNFLAGPLKFLTTKVLPFADVVAPVAKALLGVTEKVADVAPESRETLTEYGLAKPKKSSAAGRRALRHRMLM
jgi:hypothetical protein